MLIPLSLLMLLGGYLLSAHTCFLLFLKWEGVIDLGGGGESNKLVFRKSDVFV